MLSKDEGVCLQTTLWFLLLQGLPEGGLRRIILTASGGAFRDWPVEKLKDVSVCSKVWIKAKLGRDRKARLEDQCYNHAVP